MTLRRKKTFWILGASLALLAGGAILFFFLLADEAPSPDEDLRVFRRRVVDRDNGFLLVNGSKEDVFWPEDDEAIRGSSKKFDPEQAAEVIEKNKEVLKRFEESLESPEFQGPEMRTMEDRVPYLLKWRRLAYLLSSRNRKFLECGKEKEAIEGALQLIRFGWRIEGSQGMLINYLVGVALQSIGVKDLLRTLKTTDLEPSELGPFISDLGRYTSDNEGLCDTLRAEYLVVSNTWEQMVRGDYEGIEDLDQGFFARLLSRRPFFKLNQAKRYAGRGSEELDSSSVSACFEERAHGRGSEIWRERHG